MFDTKTTFVLWSKIGEKMRGQANNAIPIAGRLVTVVNGINAMVRMRSNFIPGTGSIVTTGRNVKISILGYASCLCTDLSGKLSPDGSLLVAPVFNP